MESTCGAGADLVGYMTLGSITDDELSSQGFYHAFRYDKDTITKIDWRQQFSSHRRRKFPFCGGAAIFPRGTFTSLFKLHKNTGMPHCFPAR